MAERIRFGIAPGYLFLCLLLGGSAQGIWQNMALQLLGLAILAWAASSSAGTRIEGPASHLLAICPLALMLVALQLVPLPPSLWEHLGGRAFIAEGYRTLGIKTPWLPLSLAPYRSLESLLGLIPPLALLAAMVRMGAYRANWLAAAILLGAIAGVILGALQVSGSGDMAQSPWYLYAETSYGLASGFFANANHMASLLVCTIPVLAAYVSKKSNRRNPVAIIAAAAGAVLVMVGIALNHSLAVYALTPPVLAASGLIVVRRQTKWRGVWAAGVAILAIAAVGGLATASAQTGRFGEDTRSSVQSRQEMLVISARALRDFFPAGSGLGSFRGVYRLYEHPAQVTNTYVPHAHNDYVELALEMGAGGILLMLAFLAWWARAVWQTWRADDPAPYAQAASIASGAILLHSMVDFPLRTTAISALLAACLALLVERPRKPAQVRSDLRPARHVVIE